MFNTKKFKQAFIEAGKQTAKKKQELVKKYKELQEKELVESKVNWIMETIKDLVETWNAKEGENKMLLIYVMGTGRVGHLGTIGSQELTGVDQDSSIETVVCDSYICNAGGGASYDLSALTDIDEVKKRFEKKFPRIDVIDFKNAMEVGVQDRVWQFFLPYLEK